MKKTVISGAVAALLAVPAMAQNTGTAGLDEVRQEIEALKQKNERLESEVEYLKENTKAQRKDAANAAVDVANLKTTTSKYTWGGDFRFRDEEISTASANNVDEHTRSRQRIRVRFGVTAKVNDTITAKIQLSTTNSGNDSSRSTNQTLGSGWDRKPVSFDQAYVDWKASSMFNVQLGKMPMPWTTTTSYFWDKDLTPEGAALKFARGPFFAGAFYTWLNERNVSNNQAASTDGKMAGVQAGLKQSFGKSTLTAAVGYFDLSGVQDQVVKFNAGTTTANLTTGAVTTSGACAIDGAFGAGQGTGDNSFGNSTYTGAAPGVGSSSSCTRLLSDFNILTALVQYDFSLGKFPVTAFVDYMKNNGAKEIVVGGVSDTFDTAYAGGLTFNKASAAKSWEVGVVYQKTGKDAVFAQFVDSDFGGGQTDAKGWLIKGAYVPAANWTLNAQYFINKLNNDGVAANAVNHDLNYRRLQLDANYKF